MTAAAETGVSSPAPTHCLCSAEALRPARKAVKKKKKKTARWKTNKSYSPTCTAMSGRSQLCTTAPGRRYDQGRLRHPAPRRTRTNPTPLRRSDRPSGDGLGLMRLNHAPNEYRESLLCRAPKQESGQHTEELRGIGKHPVLGAFAPGRLAVAPPVHPPVCVYPPLHLSACPSVRLSPTLTSPLLTSHRNTRLTSKTPSPAHAHPQFAYPIYRPPV
jgi:hypothetical protein